MKKIFSFAVLFAAMSLVACGGEQPKAEEAEEAVVEEVVVEEAPAAPVVKAEKVEVSEPTIEDVKAADSNVKLTESGLTLGNEKKNESQFQVKKEPIQTIDESAKVKVPINAAKEGIQTTKAEPTLSVGEGSSLKVAGTAAAPIKKK